MKIKIEKSELRIDAMELVQAMDQKTRAEMARFLCADERLFSNVLDCVVTGEYNADDDDGAWWFGAESIANLREKLLPLLTEATRGLVRNALYERDSARKNEERYREWSWKMHHAWQDADPASHARSCPRSAEYQAAAYPSDQRVDEALGLRVTE